MTNRKYDLKDLIVKQLSTNVMRVIPDLTRLL